MEKPVVVISAINLFEGGTLSILNDCLTYLSNLSSQYRIVAYVHNKDLVVKNDGIELIEVPSSRKSYCHRFYYEYWWFRKESQRLKPYLWFSLHDMTPSVQATIRAVYCHNPSPFYKASWKDVLYEPTIGLFSLFYKYIYRINIRKNNFVVVQQHWISEAFKKMYRVDNVLVSKPNVEVLMLENIGKIEYSVPTFFYASLPRVFKNFEVIAETARILIQKNITDFQMIITVDGSENKYAHWLKKTYGDIPQLKFIGRISREEVLKNMNSADAVIFPSRLETWGLPITEAKALNKTIFLSDLPYAHETLGDYDKGVFFDPNSAKTLARILIQFLNKSLIINPITAKKYTGECTSWKELFEKILNS